MMDITFDKEKIIELAKALTPVHDMAILMDVPEMELQIELADPLSEIARAYRKAKAEISLELRKNNIELAKAGSPTAAEAVDQYLMNLDEE